MQVEDVCCDACSIKFFILLRGKINGCTESQFYYAEFMRQIYYTVECITLQKLLIKEMLFVNQNFKHSSYYIPYSFVARISGDNESFQPSSGLFQMLAVSKWRRL